MRFQGYLRTLEIKSVPKLFNIPAVLLGGTAGTAVPGNKESLYGSTKLLEFFFGGKVFCIIRNQFGSNAFIQAVNYPEGVVYRTFPYINDITRTDIL